MKVVLIGGHLSPALSVIQKLKKENVFYIGRRHVFEGDDALSLEHEEIVKLGIPFYSIKTARMQRKITRYTFLSLTKFPLGFYQSIKILKEIKPDVVLGFGGYVQIPVVLAAYILKIPVVIHEQTLEAGFANKLVSGLAKKICISFESSKEFFPKEKTVLTGNPVKEEIINAKGEKINNKVPVIYITGGSTGSHFINNLIEKTLPKLLEKYIVIHQTGDSKKYKDFDKLKDLKNNLTKNFSQKYEIKKFLNANEAAKAISKADLVIGRSGINTVTELIYLKKPAFLIPLPFGQKNEQLKNAEFLKSLGLCEFIVQASLSESLFISAVNSMVKNLANYKLLKSFVLENSADKIVAVLKNVSKEKTA